MVGLAIPAVALRRFPLTGGRCSSGAGQAHGRKAIELAESRIGGGGGTFLQFAREIAFGHHERWDGRGYPQGLAGEANPLPARLMAVADVYDALISRRVYKEPMPHDEAVKTIVDQCGTQFDPDVIEAFSRVADRFAEIALECSDGA